MSIRDLLRYISSYRVFMWKLYPFLSLSIQRMHIDRNNTLNAYESSTWTISRNWDLRSLSQFQCKEILFRLTEWEFSFVLWHFLFLHLWIINIFTSVDYILNFLLLPLRYFSISYTRQQYVVYHCLCATPVLLISSLLC